MVGALAWAGLALLTVDAAASDSPSSDLRARNSSVNMASPAGRSPVTLSYDAPWECPDRAQFWRQLRMRSRRLAASKLDESGISIDARISGSGSLYVGHLRLVESGSAVVERDVGGPNCVDVSNALALITAVTLDASPAATRTDFSVTVKQKSTKAFAIGPVGAQGFQTPSSCKPTP